ncbi:MAG: hypothetical protein BGO41_11935 [Clostridiales bacterium 38-18]|nr:MAG: hypothetical protein BGO41_11935 [Clostridiales bacterium 38-18]
MISISLKSTVFELCESYPDMKNVLFELGFVDIVKPGMLQTVGRVMTLEKGSRLKNIALSTINDQLKQHGFELKEDEYE